MDTLKGRPVSGRPISQPQTGTLQALCCARRHKLYSQTEKPLQALTGTIQQGLQNTVTDNLPVTCRATAQSKSQQKVAKGSKSGRDVLSSHNLSRV